MTDPVVPATQQPEISPQKSHRIEVARGTDGRHVVLPRSVVVASAWTWRVLLIGLGIYVALFVVLGRVWVVVAPLLLALLVAALLYPLHKLFRRIRIPAVLAAVLSILILLGVVAGAVWFVQRQIMSGFEGFTGQISLGVEELSQRLAEVLPVIEAERIEGLLVQARDQISAYSGQIAAGVTTVASTAVTVLTGLLLALFATIFFLADGPRIWRFVTRLLPLEAREGAFVAGQEAWGSAGRYVRTLPLVALMDAIGIGGGAWLLGVPFALPIGVLTFFAAFIPIVGAIVAGTVAVLIALVSDGVTTAVLMLVVILVVQQLEGNVFLPLLLGKALDLHPLAVVLATTIGILLLGIVGGIVAVPILAAVIVAVQSLRRGEVDERHRAEEAVDGSTRAGADPPEERDRDEDSTTVQDTT